MSVSGRKGWAGETGVREFLRLWFPEGHPGRDMLERAKSSGSNDVGDISGVAHSMIEVKNHSSPVFGSLMANAEFKASNAKRPIWFLNAKRAGFGNPNAWRWHAITSVSGLISGFQPFVRDMNAALTVDMVPDLMASEEDLVMNVTAEHLGLIPSPKPWNMMVMFRNRIAGAQNVWESVVDSFGAGYGGPGFASFRTEDGVDVRQIGVVVSPRRDKDPEDWYVYMNIHGMARLLETVGSLPHDPNDSIYQHEQEGDAQ